MISSKNRFWFLLPAFLVMLPGCLERQFAETQAKLTTQAEELVVPCDLTAGRNLVRDTIFVTANRSWSAAIVEEGIDWMTISAPGHQDMARVTEVVPLALAFQDNETDEARTATVHITSADGDRDVTIRQEAISYRLQVRSDLGPFEAVSSEGDTIKLKINSNTSWSAQLKEGSEADVRFSKNARETAATPSLEGKYSQTLDVVILENDELEEKAAVIVLSATGCDPIEIPVSQAKGRPYFRVIGPETLEAEPGRADATLDIKTNIAWTAELVSAEGYEAGEVKVPTGGAKTAKTVKVTFPYCIDFNTPGHIVLRFNGEGLETPVEYVITQRPCIRIMWYDYKNAKLVGASSSTYPFTTPPLSDIVTSASNAKAQYKKSEFEMVTKRGGFVFKVYSTPGIWRNGGTGLMFGATVGDYLKLPVIEGHRLVRIDYGFGATRNSTSTLKLDVKNPDGQTVEGGEIRMSCNNVPRTDVFELSGTAAGVEYSLVQQATVNFGIGDLILYYE